MLNIYLNMLKSSVNLLSCNKRDGKKNCSQTEFLLGDLIDEELETRKNFINSTVLFLNKEKTSKIYAL